MILLILRTTYRDRSLSASDFSGPTPNPFSVEPRSSPIKDIEDSRRRIRQTYRSFNMSRHPHPLSALTVEESIVARDVIRSLHPDSVLLFRQIFLFEPPKAQVTAFLELEHSGKLTDETSRPCRLAQVWFDVCGRDQAANYAESVIDLRTKTVVSTQTTGPGQLASLIM